MMKNKIRYVLMIAMLSISVAFTFGYAETNSLSTENQPVAAPAAQPAAPAATPATASPSAAAPEAAAPAATAAPTTAASAPAATPATPATPAPATADAAAPAAAPATAENNDQDTRKIVARVVWIKGKFNATKPGSAETRELKTAANIYMNDTLLTEANSEAQIIFTDNSTMTFRPDTKLYINEYNYQPKSEVKQGEKKSAGRYILDLVTGGFRTVTGMVAKENPNDYAVNTPVATIGVRGTEYSIVYKQGQDLYIKRYAGEPCMANNATKKGDTKGIVQQTNIGGGGAAASGQSNEVCLNENQKYGYVQSNDVPPAVLMRQPEVFRTDVEVIPVKFSSTGSFGGTTTGPGQSGNSNNQGNSGSSSGFCIQ